MADDWRIPAASIGDVDLEAVAQRFPNEAREIARISDLMDYGKESAEEFCRLCELLHQVGATKDAEYLLRRNIGYDGGRELYQRLFGTAVPDEYAQAISHFGKEFGLELTPETERDFLDWDYFSTPLNDETPRFNILDNPCVIRFDYSHREFVIADVIEAKANEEEVVNYFDLNTNVYFRWQHGRWRLIDPREA